INRSKGPGAGFGLGDGPGVQCRFHGVLLVTCSCLLPLPSYICSIRAKKKDDLKTINYKNNRYHSVSSWRGVLPFWQGVGFMSRIAYNGRISVNFILAIMLKERLGCTRIKKEGP
ncbi:MAG: hypothetical protein P8Y63_14395, partial [Deltaproteobacteria bacterium]